MISARFGVLSAKHASSTQHIAVLYQYQYQRDHLIGQSTTTQLAQIKTQWTSLEPSVERDGVWNKS